MTKGDGAADGAVGGHKFNLEIEEARSKRTLN